MVLTRQAQAFTLLQLMLVQRPSHPAPIHPSVALLTLTPHPLPQGAREEK